MRVLVVDPDRARSALVVEGLQGLDPLVVREASALDGAEIQVFRPDLIIVACDSPDRDTLESLRETSAVNARPVVMFVDRSEPGLAESAVQAGVAAGRHGCRGDSGAGTARHSQPTRRASTWPPPWGSPSN